MYLWNSQFGYFYHQRMLLYHWSILHPFVVEDVGDGLPEPVHSIMQRILKLVHIDGRLLLEYTETKWDTDLNRGSHHGYERGYPHVWMPCVKCGPFQPVMQHSKGLSCQLNILILTIQMYCEILISEHNFKEVFPLRIGTVASLRTSFHEVILGARPLHDCLFDKYHAYTIL